MELRLPLEMSPGREAACRAVLEPGVFSEGRTEKLPLPVEFIHRVDFERCPGIGFLSRGDREIGVLRNVEPPTRPHLECLRETGLILRCPIRRAPSRLTAVARSALPYSARSKNCHSATISTTEAAKMISVWPLSASAPISNRSCQKLGLRKPSAPKKNRPRPVNTKCTPTETISSTSTLASAIDWNARR